MKFSFMNLLYAFTLLLFWCTVSVQYDWPKAFNFLVALGLVYVFPVFMLEGDKNDG